MHGYVCLYMIQIRAASNPESITWSLSHCMKPISPSCTLLCTGEMSYATFSVGELIAVRGYVFYWLWLCTQWSAGFRGPGFRVQLQCMAQFGREFGHVNLPCIPCTGAHTHITSRLINHITYRSYIPNILFVFASYLIHLTFHCHECEMNRSY